MNNATITFTRTQLKRTLVSFGMSNNNIEELIGAMEHGRRHMNIISFAAFMERTGMTRDMLVALLRKLGVEGIVIHNVLEMLDEYKIGAEAGKIYTATIDFGDKQ